jgi:excisionase family DNA binding protein
MQQDEPPADLMTTKAAARLVNNCHPHTIKRWVYKGRLRGYRIGPGNVLFVSRADILAMIRVVEPKERHPMPATAKEIRQDEEWVDRALREAGVRK